MLRNILQPTNPLAINSNAIGLVKRRLTFHNDGQYFAADSAAHPSTLHRHQVIRLLHRVYDGLLVQRSDCP